MLDDAIDLLPQSKLVKLVHIGVDWAKVFPSWFACPGAIAASEEYARQVLAAVDEFEKFRRGKHLATARRIATREQRDALQAATRSADLSPAEAR